jgi:hypothetical protein
MSAASLKPASSGPVCARMREVSKMSFSREEGDRVGSVNCWNARLKT